MRKNKLIGFFQKVVRVLTEDIVREAVRDVQQEVLASQHIVPFTREYFPWTTGSLRPSCLITIINDMLIHNRERIVECGAGVSTLVMARVAQRTGARVLSVEEDSWWASFVQKSLAAEGLDKYASIVQAPLRESNLSLDGQPWYDTETLTAAMSSFSDNVDLLIVDGPGVGTIRYPAVPFFLRYLGGDHTVIVDDIPRGTNLFIDRWGRELGLQFRVIQREFAIASTQTSMKLFLMP